MKSGFSHGIFFRQVAREARSFLLLDLCSAGNRGGQRDRNAKKPDSFSVRFKIFVDVSLDHVKLCSSVHDSGPGLDVNHSVSCNVFRRAWITLRFFIGSFSVSRRNGFSSDSLQLRVCETIQTRSPVLVMNQFREPSGNPTLTSFPKVRVNCSLFQNTSSEATLQCFDQDDAHMKAKNCSKQSRSVHSEWRLTRRRITRIIWPFSHYSTFRLQDPRVGGQFRP